MKIYYALCTFIAAFALLTQCKRESVGGNIPEGATSIPASVQRTGDATQGYNYLISGDYISSGIPLEIFKTVNSSNSPDDLGRAGDNKGIPYNFSVIAASNGVKVVALNCLSCHADKINGQLIVGLGNHSSDNTVDQTNQLNLLDPAVQFRYGGKSSKEWVAYEPFSRGFRAIGPSIITNVRGANPADKIFAALSGHRDKNTLQWITQPTYNIPKETVPTDVPAWWLLKKKNALYYNGIGKGDFARLIMASALLTMKDSAEARVIDSKFPNVLAYLKSIQAPKYPFTIDQTLAQTGKGVFEINCQKCHGSYGTNASYPNLLIDLRTVGTDPALSDLYFSNPQYHTWFNESWFNKPPFAAQLLPNKGYVAPPLDGIWATAPYLHNGSVPTLEDLLNSPQRPAYWRRSFDDKDYDAQKVGWKYESKTKKEDIQTYDTQQTGYGNGGHIFGDKLTNDERKALMEYLKTL